jgi:serine/threonine protein kinase/WD40 repeat protein
VEDTEKAAIVARYRALHPEFVASIDAAAAAIVGLGALCGGEPTSSVGHAHGCARGISPIQIGPYRIVRELDRGGMGIVYEARDGVLPRRVAVKTIKRAYADRRDFRERFERERAVLARLHHTHIVPIYSTGDEGGLPYLAMPFIEGATLKELIPTLRRHSASIGGLSSSSLHDLIKESQMRSTEAGETATLSAHENASSAPNPPDAPVLNGQALCYPIDHLRAIAGTIATVAEALHQAHAAGIVHRDIKPSNIILEPSGHPWVLDFGLARFEPKCEGRVSLETRPDQLDTASPGELTVGPLGTPEYMAPEQHEPDSGHAADPRTDVWGLGVTLYELLTLKRAFSCPDADTSKLRALTLETDPVRPGRCVRNLPRDLEAICVKALDKKPDQRYQSAHELADDLRRWIDRRPISLWRRKPGYRLRLWAHRQPVLAATIGLLTCSALGVFGLITAVSRAREARATAEAKTTKVELAAAVEREQIQRREVILQNLARLRLKAHVQGWSADAWDLVRQAAAIRRDPALQSEVVATLKDVDAQTLKEFREFGAKSLAFDREGRRLLIGGVSDAGDSQKKQGAKLWDDATQQLDDLQVAGPGPVGFRADGTPVQLLIEEGDPPALVLMNLAKRQPITRFAIPPKGKIEPEATAMTPDARLSGVLVTLPDGKTTLCAWDSATGNPVLSVAVHAGCLAFSPDGALIALGTESGEIQVLSAATGQTLAVLKNGRNRINCVAFGPDRHRTTGAQPARTALSWLLAVGDAGGMVTIWDLAQRSVQSFCLGSAYEVYVVAFSPDGVTLASSGRGATKLWDVRTGRSLLDVWGPGADYSLGVAFSPDGRRVAVGIQKAFSAGSVGILNLDQGRGIQTLRGLRGRVERAIFSPDGTLVAGLSNDWQVGIWDGATGHLRHLLDIPQGDFIDNAGLAFSPDSRRFAFSAGREAKLWELDSGAQVGSWSFPPGLQDAVAFQAPDRLLVFRVETKSGQVPPYSEYPPREHPRVCRLRRLEDQHRAVLIKQIADFNHYDFQNEVSLDGKIIVSAGLGGPNGSVGSLRVYESAAGTTLWSMPLRLKERNTIFRLDPAGNILSLGEAIESPANLLEMPSGVARGTIHPSAFVLGPRAKLWFAPTGHERNPYDRWGLFGAGRDRALVEFPLEVLRATCHSTFSPDGGRVLWANDDSAVSVLDLKEIQRRLAQVDLGW